MTSKCEKDIRTGNVSVCYEDKPVWNAEYLRCEECPLNTYWNAGVKKCVALTINSTGHKHNHQHRSKKKNHKLEIKNDDNNEEFIEGEVYGNS